LIYASDNLSPIAAQRRATSGAALALLGKRICTIKYDKQLLLLKN
jgi:hypothetical protein